MVLISFPLNIGKKIPLPVLRKIQPQSFLGSGEEDFYVSSNNFVIPKPNKELFKHSMSYSGTLIWNVLPQHVKLSNNISTFHNRCIKWMKR